MNKNNADNVTWEIPGMGTIKYAIIYDDISRPSGWKRFNPFSWISYWCKTRNNKNIIGYFEVDKEFQEGQIFSLDMEGIEILDYFDGLDDD